MAKFSLKWRGRDQKSVDASARVHASRATVVVRSRGRLAYLVLPEVLVVPIPASDFLIKFGGYYHCAVFFV